MPNPPRIVVLGRQGAGKGTQCARLAAYLGVPHLSTGDLFRTAVRDGTPVGVQVAGYLERGELVPDELVVGIVQEHAAAEGLDDRGYLLDGFPRTIAQAELFLGSDGKGVDVAVELDVPVDVVVERIARRRVCPVDGWTTIVDDPSVAAVPCPDGHDAVQREDDTPEAVRRRLALYERETGPLGPWFAQRGLLERVDGVGDPDEVFDRILGALRARGLLSAA
ncbi:MAG: nucleoside monophosphate kinase [Actinobacteria bacterium]|nr:nucleoside monophosphate kinase [Actinomycetota bacterium]